MAVLEALVIMKGSWWNPANMDFISSHKASKIHHQWHGHIYQQQKNWLVTDGTVHLSDICY